ncbi:hypothetical protein ACFSUS_05155 [Spirosoma soli]|uniref:Uncharacterized protein n=1 Tax=Spirosoma soli TaxID=1770529 RepID=A0ABW5M153_9BACT
MAPALWGRAYATGPAQLPSITAIQDDKTAQYTFDLKAYVSAYCGYVPPSGGSSITTLTLLPPTYDCGSGAFTFRTSGGDGSAVEYQANSIISWTTNPNQFVDQESRTANDVQPFTLMAHQSGQVVT